MRKAFSILITLVGSSAAVYADYKSPSIGQWMYLYSWVFICAWQGGLFEGVISTVFSLSLAGVYLVPAEVFGPQHVLMLMALTAVGIWVSYSLELHRRAREAFRASEELEKAKGFLDTLIDSIPMMIFVKDAEDLSYLNLNDFGMKLMGLKREEVIGKSDYNFFNKAKADSIRRRDREVLAGAKVKDFPLEEIEVNGRRVLLRTRKIPIMGENGKPLWLLGVSEDVTELVAREKKQTFDLQEEAARRERMKIHEREIILAQAISDLTQSIDYQETIDGIVKAMVPAIGDCAILSIVDEEGKLSRASGHHRDEKVMPYIEEFLRDFPPSEEDTEIMRALREGRPTLESFATYQELVDLKRDQRKTELWDILGTYSTAIVPVRSREGVLGVLSMSRGIDRAPFDELDLTLCMEIGRRAGTVLDNTRLFQSTQKAVRARDEFLSIASHELKTPITSLRLQLEMLTRAGKIKDPERSINNAIRQVDRLTLLVNDLLDVGRLESGKMNYHLSHVSLNELVEEVTESMRPQFQESGMELSLSVKDQSMVIADRYRMEQVLVNLLNNSLKYGLGRPVHVSLHRISNRALIKVKDLGVGIPHNQLKRIFGKFERGGKVSSIAGLGLGLYITQEIVRAFNGSIQVKSVEGEWTEFTVTLPII